jgi:hypothetical protein
MTDLLLPESSGPALLKRQLRSDDIKCPAGSVIGDAGCWCALEQGVIDGRTQTTSIGAYCMSVEGHKECPTWQAEKDRIADSKDLRKSLLERPKVKRTPYALRQQRLREAQERLVADTPEGRRFRRRLGLPG